MAKTVAVIGGAGYIGSYVNKFLHQKGYKTVVFDNLSRGSQSSVVCGDFLKGDIGSNADLDQLFTTHTIDAVMHFAAFTDVGESVENPSIYYQNNVCNTLNLLNGMLRHGVKTLIFSSTAAIYGTPQNDTVTETHPHSPINPYGESKLMVEKILRDFDAAYGLRYCSLRYFNAAGGDPDGEIKFDQSKGLNLIPIVLKSIKQNSGKVSIFGTDYTTPDGTCIRDYIHVADLASAHVMAMERLWEGSPSNQYNLGNGRGHSVKEVLDSIEKITQKDLTRELSPRRAGDPAVLIADSTKARKEMGWTPEHEDLDDMIATAWKAFNHEL